MWTDTYGELEDKRQIAKLKQERFFQKGMVEKSGAAGHLRSLYTKARDQLVLECRLGITVPRTKEVLRYHDHAKVEGVWAGKEAQWTNEPTSLTEAREELWKVHSRYWDLQGKVNNLKGFIDSQQRGSETRNELYEQFVEAQREIDLCNEHRNHLIAKIDHFFLIECLGTPKLSQWK